MAGITDITKLYVGYFNRAPDPAGLQYWLDQADEGMTLSEIAESFAVQSESTSLYPFLQFPDVSSPTAFINSVYLNLFNRAADEEGLEYWTGQLEGGTPIGQMIVDIMSGAQGDDATILDNKVEAGLYWAGEVANVPGFSYVDEDGAPVSDLEAAAKAALDGVDETAQSVVDSQAATDTFVVALQSGEVISGTVQLSVGADGLDGTSGNDVFVARVVQNDNGEQTNQLGTGDVLFGGSGTDTLSAKIQQASALNASPSSAIMPETNSIEIADFTALTIDNGFSGFFFGGEDRYYGYGFEAEVGVNAKYMEGLDRVGSVDSDADLIIYNLTTLTNSGEYEDRRNTEDMTIRMDHTAGLTIAGGEDSFFGRDQLTDRDGFAEDPADLTVLFDQDYVLSGQTSQGEASYFLLDQDAELRLKNGQPAEGRLDEIDRNGIRFEIDGEEYVIQFDAALLNPGNPDEVNTHEEFLAALQDALATAEAEGDIPEGLVTLELVEFGQILFDENGDRLNQAALQDGTFSDEIPGVVVRTTDGSAITPLGYTVPPEITGEFNVFGRFDDEFEQAQNPIAVDVELLKVGRAQDGGELSVGSMDTTGNYFSLGGPGIQVFNVTVEGDDTQDSSLAAMRSTNNTLEAVNLTNAAGSEADIEIGNAFSRAPNGAGLVDVRDFLAGSFENDISLRAWISDNVLAKYFDRTDTQVDPDEEDVEFTYEFGRGDDMFDLLLDADPFGFDGNITQEDFELSVSMGAGSDTVRMENDRTADVTNARNTDWYVQHIVDKDGEPSGKNADADINVNVDLGSGDDSMVAFGATAYSIDGGSGNDVIFADNSGGSAVWVYNSFDADQSSPRTQPEIIARNIANMDLTVEFLGISSTVEVANSNGSRTGVTLTDLDIVQSIKRAINDDDTLSELLLAEDSAGRALNVYSQIDGLLAAGDLTVTVGNSGGLSTAQANAGAELFVDNSGETALGFDRTTGEAVADDADDTTSGDGRWDDPASISFAGFDSNQANNNTIEGGTGDDILVLSSSASGTGLEVGGSTETVVIDGAFGNDVLVNFKAATNPEGPFEETVLEDGTLGDFENQGYDIFDVAGVLGGNAEGVANDTSSDAEQVIANAGNNDALANKWVIISNAAALDNDANTNRAQELANVYNGFDDGSNDEDNLVILVDGDNVGTFFHVQNGGGAEDVSVARLGSIHMTEYESAAKSALGDWSGLDLDNFTPLTQTQLFDVI